MLVRLGHVFIDGDAACALRAPDVTCDTFVIEEDLEHSIRQHDIDPSSDQRMRHGIEGLVDLDMDLRRLPFRVFERR